MSFLANIRHKLMVAKTVIVRVNSYIGLMNFVMIIFLTLSNLKENNYINIDLGKYLIPAYIGLIFLLYLIGYLEIYKWKGLNEEQKVVYSLTPMHPKMEEMYEDFKRRQNEKTKLVD